MINFFKKVDKNQITLISLIIFIFIALFSTFNYLSLDKTPPHWDYALHLKYSLIYFQALENLDLLKLISTYTFYPPLTYIMFSFFIAIIGYSKSTVLAFNLSLLTILLSVAYLFTKKLSDKFTSLTLVGLLFFLTFGLHPSNIFIWELMTDFPLMVFVFIIYCLFYQSFKNKNFTSKRSLQLGILIALALLTKWSAIIYLIVPIIFYLISIPKKKYLKQGLFMLLPVLILGGIWYFPHFKKVILDLLKYSIHQGYLEQDPQWFNGINFYFKNFLVTSWPVNIIVILLLATSMITFLKNKELFKQDQFLGIFDWLFITVPSILFIIFIPNKDPRYLYPIIILAISICFWRIRKYFNINKVWFVIPPFFLLITLNYNQFLPYPMPDSLIDHLKQTVWERKPKSIAYFFETDSHLFNYGNVSLFYKEIEYLYNIKQVSHSFLNQMNVEDDRRIHGCSYFGEPEMIVVFRKKNLADIVNPK